MRVAIAHDWLVRYAGSERCVEQMLAEFPGARLLTSVFDRDALPAGFAQAEPSFLQRVPGATRRHELLLPLMPAAWRLREPVRDVDVVVSSSHACAMAVRFEGAIPHVCYCHTPMRYAWDFTSEAARFPRLIRRVARPVMAGYRNWDRATSRRVTTFVANSSAVAGRIEAAYGRQAEVIHPPVLTEFFTPGGERGDEYLYVGRLVSYKRADLVVEAFRGLPYRLLVVGEGHLERSLRASAPDNVTFLGTVSDDRLRELYRSARALVFPANEDFGIAMAEAQACGTPVIGLAQGGALDIVAHGRTGWLLDDATVDDLRRMIRRTAEERLDAAAIASEAQRFSAARFRAAFRELVDNAVDQHPQRLRAKRLTRAA
ncbi:MAG: glycosyltransferase [Gaiellaceae bacterium]